MKLPSKLSRCLFFLKAFRVELPPPQNIYMFLHRPHATQAGAGLRDGARNCVSGALYMESVCSSTLSQKRSNSTTRSFQTDDWIALPRWSVKPRIFFAIWLFVPSRASFTSHSMLWLNHASCCLQDNRTNATSNQWLIGSVCLSRKQG